MPIGKTQRSKDLDFQTTLLTVFKEFAAWHFFRLRPFRIKCEQHYSSENTFLFRQIFFRNREHFSFTHVIKADWTFVIWTQGSQHSIANQDLQREVKATTSYEKVNNEDSQLKKEKWYETIQNQLSHHKQILKKKTKVI